jgi:hypothetical protein
MLSHKGFKKTFINVQLEYKRKNTNQLKILMIFITYFGLQTQIISMRSLQ